MVAALGLLELVEVGVEVGLVGEGGGVEALQHRAVGVAAPVRAGHLHDLEGLPDLARGGHVRAAAEVLPVALLVDLEVLARLIMSTSSILNVLAALGEPGLGLLARPVFLGEGAVARDDLAHALLDRREVLGRERLGAVEVVVEAVLDHRADGDLRAGPEPLHRLGQHVRRVVADELEGSGVLAREELELGVGVERVGEVGEHAVAHHGDGALGEAGRDGFRDVEAGDAGLERTGVAVGKGDGDHGARLLGLTRRYGSA